MKQYETIHFVNYHLQGDVPHPFGMVAVPTSASKIATTEYLEIFKCEKDCY